MQRTLIIIGIVILIVGLLWPWLIKLPIGRLPGDIIIDKPNFKLYIPITTMLIINADLLVVPEIVLLMLDSGFQILDTR